MVSKLGKRRIHQGNNLWQEEGIVLEHVVINTSRELSVKWFLAQEQKSLFIRSSDRNYYRMCMTFKPYIDIALETPRYHNRRGHMDWLNTVHHCIKTICETESAREEAIHQFVQKCCQVLRARLHTSKMS